jgi:hypothetical protein
MVDCAQAGVASASSDNAPGGEGIALAFDDDSGTKWLSFSSSASVQYALAQACAVRWYTLTSANDFPERDPADWQLDGSEDGRVWESLDVRRGQDFAWRRQTRVFEVKKTSPYKFYRLTVTRNHAGSITQLAEIELLDDRRPVVGKTDPADTGLSDGVGAGVPAVCGVGSCGSSAIGAWAAAIGLVAFLSLARRARRPR